MKARYIVALFCFIYQISLAQVGIGTTSPSASLDIQSSNQATPSNTDGLLIPKIDEYPASNPGANQDGMLVYVTGNGAPAKGFYYWDNATTTWVNVKGVAVENDPKVGTLASGYVPRWNSTSLEDGTIFNSATNVGIGTINPQRLLDARSGTGTPTPDWISGTFGPTNTGDRIVLGNLNGNATIGSHNSALNAWADLYLNPVGRVEIPHIVDASHLTGSGSLEIGNRLRIDDNEIITNSNAVLYLNNNNNGDVIIDDNTLRVDASTNKVGIGTATPGTIITNSKLDVVGGHIAISNNFGVLSFNNAGSTYGAGFDTTPTDDLHLYAGGSNRLNVTNSGNVSAPSFSIAGINATGNRALITKEYADANYSDATFSGDYNDLINLPTLFSGDYNDLTNQPTISSPTGLEAIDEGNGIGWRLIGRNPANHGNIGLNAVDLTTSPFSGSSGATGESSFAAGRQATASGQYSVAIGSSQSSGIWSASMGVGNLSLGDRSYTFGQGNVTYNENSIAIGRTSTTNANNSIAIGYYTSANSFQCMALGSWNIRNTTLTNSYSTTTWVPTDPIFVVGNGIDINNQSDALTILKNGNVGIGTQTPGYALHVASGNTFGIGASPSYYMHPTAGHGSAGAGWSYAIVASVGRIYAEGGFGTGSDSRIKDIKGVSNSKEDLEKLMNIEITNYTYKDSIAKGNDVTKKVIAQQVKEVLPNAISLTTEFIPNIYTIAEATKVNDKTLQLTFKDAPELLVDDTIKLFPKDKAEMQARVVSVYKNVVVIAVEDVDLGDEIFVYGKQIDDFHTVDYDAISMLNVSATQEQQKLIEQQQKEIKALMLKLQNFETLSSRIEKIEAQLTPTNQ